MQPNILKRGVGVGRVRGDRILHIPELCVLSLPFFPHTQLPLLTAGICSETCPHFCLWLKFHYSPECLLQNWPRKWTSHAGMGVASPQGSSCPWALLPRPPGASLYPKGVCDTRAPSVQVLSSWIPRQLLWTNPNPDCLGLHCLLFSN